jgi:predicted acetyltransferase
MASVEIIPSTVDTAHIIRNLYPLYLHDLSEFTGDLPNANGIYEPAGVVARTLEEQGQLAYQRLWWEKPGVLHPLLIKADRAVAGFALVAAPPYAPADADCCVQEFFIVRSLRRRGVGSRAARGLRSIKRAVGGSRASAERARRVVLAKRRRPLRAWIIYPGRGDHLRRGADDISI